jgi:hypothetical protein
MRGRTSVDKTAFSKKCEILGMLWTFYKDSDDEGWQEFFRWADVGLPLAYLVWSDLATASKEGKTFVNDTWIQFCKMIDIDPSGRYDNIKQTFETSPNPPLEE